MKPFIIEVIVEFAIAIAVIILRIYARTKVVGFRGWKGDDWLIIIVTMAFITEIIFFPLIVNEHESANLSTLKDYTKMTDSQQAAIRKVALLDIGAWILYTTLIWGCKGCMLFIYSRLSFGLWQEKMIKTAAVASILSYIAVIITVTCHCLPYSKFWEKTNTPAHCTLDIENFYVVGITNFLTDALIVAIPIPLLFRIRLPLRRKLVIGLFLCSGIFVMAATVMRTVESLLVFYKRSYNEDYGKVIGWGLRENFVAILVVNAPCIKPLFHAGKFLRSRTNTVNPTGGDMEGTIGSMGKRSTGGGNGVDVLETICSDVEVSGVGGVGVYGRDEEEGVSRLPAAFRKGSIVDKQRKMSVGFEDLMEGMLDVKSANEDGGNRRPSQGRKASLFDVRRKMSRREPAVLEEPRAEDEKSEEGKGEGVEERIEEIQWTKNYTSS